MTFLERSGLENQPIFFGFRIQGVEFTWNWKVLFQDLFWAFKVLKPSKKPKPQTPKFSDGGRLLELNPTVNNIIYRIYFKILGILRASSSSRKWSFRCLAKISPSLFCQKKDTTRNTTCIQKGRDSKRDTLWLSVQLDIAVMIVTWIISMQARKFVFFSTLRSLNPSTFERV